ncbi:hypothetical protein TNCV_3211191 [Trichonephila clavipes]|uniref:Uncharacterized protein n=1 Tax=Trichonephila clavipes TaxID=2585209 RepID=A0A8X6RX40_TRICX|nr:hypothetical protein TNCV_3211191 [Trichonephila clavipes]
MLHCLRSRPARRVILPHPLCNPPQPTKRGQKTPWAQYPEEIYDFCERWFETPEALEDQARCLHGEESQMTFAIHDEYEPSEQQGVPGNEPWVFGNDFLSVRCSATTPVGFLSQAALDRHVELCHASTTNTNDVPASSATTSDKAVWCPHCLHLI